MPALDARAWARDDSGMADRAQRHPVSLAPFLHAALAPRDGANDAHAADEYVTRALAAMKKDPARRWTVASLARVAGLSRAPFARRFRRATGASPLRWLTAHRLALAESLLVSRDSTLAAIAAEVGYSSEFAFSKAFKRLVGIAPASFRRVLFERARAVDALPKFRAAA